MRDYDRDEYEDYEDEGYEYEDGEEEEYEEEEKKIKPSKEEAEYLELRQKLKERFRKKLKIESGSGLNSQEKRRRPPSDNYGSFFGPSQPVISQRVIQETKSLLENQHLASKSDSLSHKPKSTTSSMVGSKIGGVYERAPKISEVQRQVQKRRETRDYSFLLSDDAEIPAPTKDPQPRTLSNPYSDARPAQVPLRNKQLLGNGTRIYANNGSSQERKPVPSNSKIVSRKPTSASQSMVSRKQLGNDNGVGPGRPSGQKPLPPKTKAPVSMERRASAPLDKRASIPMQRKEGPLVERRLSAPMGKRPLKNVQSSSNRPHPSKLQTSLSRQHLESRKGLLDPNRGRPMPKQPIVSSKPQMSKPARPLSSHSMSRDDRPKKKPSRPFPDDDDDEDPLSVIRKMFNTDRYKDAPDDDSDMEAGFDEIMAEEKRSAKIARKEDEEQLRLIEEEERRERMRMLKKRKLSQH